jgi:tripartite ATP-independent transporter DctP family solute receptor
MKKRMSFILAAVLTAVSLTGCGAGSKPAQTTTSTAAAKEEETTEKATETASKETIVLRLAETQTETYPATMGAIEFARLVEERTDGRIKIEVFTGGQLGGDEQAILEQVQFGAIDFTRANFAPILNLLQMPYLFTDADHMHKVIDSEIGTELLSSVEAGNFVGLALYDAGTRNFYNSVRPIKTVEDMKGLKIRTTQSQLIVDMVEALGASATPMAFGEVYSSLQTGVIDGAENNWVSYDQNSHYEVAKYISLDGHTAPPEILVCSKMVFDKLSPEDQQILRECAKESELWEREKYDEIENKSMEHVIAEGSEVTELEDREGFVKAVEPLYEKYAGDYMDTLQAIIDMQ